MVEPLNQDIVRYLISSSEFKVYLDWVSRVMDELNSVEGLDGMTNEKAGEEVRVRAKSLELLKQSLSPFIEYRTKREISVEEFKKASTNYGF